jgi:hypothetical protein
MIARVAGLGMGADTFSRCLGDVVEQAMPDAGLDPMRRVESVCNILLGSSVLQQILPGMGVGVHIDHRCVADGVEVAG